MTTYQELVDGLEEVRELIKGYQDVSFGDYGVAEANKAIRAVELIDSLTPASIPWYSAGVERLEREPGHEKAG